MRAAAALAAREGRNYTGSTGPVPARGGVCRGFAGEPRRAWPAGCDAGIIFAAGGIPEVRTAGFRISGKPEPPRISWIKKSFVFKGIRHARVVAQRLRNKI